MVGSLDNALVSEDMVEKVHSLSDIVGEDTARKIQGDDVPLGSERVTDNKNNGNGIKVNFRGS